ncbi:hypothetical protein STAFG_7892 [Streptomyces afghaniensis 772]|jgi:hypothetical protein|uniref:Uncharacterized protein n=1 Tax=Streptomyces afghaniensis 772 TaxID=1283301 RepID=S4MHK7_9ACTN|nr:hypothetical protein [Streptomyces afghaniensis]EPJ35050.1 hypothetical protein STAFG_7892 [Streptomyces afghaniensis 772]
MSWVSPLSALLGVLLGAGATALGDRRRWRRESVTRLLELRTELYAEYLVAMEDTGRDLLRVLRTTAGEERETAAEVAFADFNLGGTRQRIHVLAPLDVVRAADEIFRALRRARDYVAAADPQDTPGLLAMKDEVGSLRDRFQDAVRRDVRGLLSGSASWSA